MQRSLRINEEHLIHYYAKRAKEDYSFCGILQKRSDRKKSAKVYWFVLHQNLLFYFESSSTSKPEGAILLEGSYCSILNDQKLKESDFPVCYFLN